MGLFVQVVEIADLYKGTDNHITIYYVDVNGNHGQVAVVNPPHTICKAIGEDFREADIQTVVDDLNSHLTHRPPQCNRLECSCEGDKYGVYRYPCIEFRRNLGWTSPPVVSAKIIRSRGSLVYEGPDRPFLQFTLSRSLYISAACNYLNKQRYGRISTDYDGVYDKKTNGTDSFILSTRISSFDWLELPHCAVESGVLEYGDIKVCTPSMHGREADINRFYVDIETINTGSGPYREYLSKRREYPIGTISTFLVNDTSIVKRSFVLKKAPGADDDIPVEHAVFFDSEVDMLMAFRDYIIESEVDMFLGYYSNMFDYPYLLGRARKLGLRRFRYFSRDPGEPVVYREEVYESKQTGARRVCLFNCPGRVFYDVSNAVRTGFKFESYKLKKVAIELKLPIGKMDVDYSEIPVLFNGSPHQRARLIEYCDIDVYLVYLIAEKNMDLIRRLRVMCRITGVGAQQVPDRGNSYLLGMMLRREMGCSYFPISRRDKDVLEPALRAIDGYEELWKRVKDGEKYPGAFVFDPVLGLWNCCVFTLDFSSLYPSVMSTFNICPTTQIPSIKGVDPATINVSPAGYAYVKESVRKGVLPSLVERLINERVVVRAKIPSEPDAARRAMLDAEQNVLKVCANSFYGLMGSLTSIISSLSAAYSVTSYGRYYIQMVCDALMEIPDFEKKYGRTVDRPGFVEKYGMQIIYGDTDSLFVALTKIHDPGLVAKTIGPEIADWVNRISGLLIGKLKMALEKCSYPFLLISKKKYVKVFFDEKTGTYSIKLSGIENRSITKYVLNVLNYVLHMGLVDRANTDAIEGVIVAAAARIWRGEIPAERLRHSNSLSKSIESYKGDSPHLIAARQLIAAGISVVEGDRIPYYFCNVAERTGGVKGELTVAADLYEYGFTLHAPSYVEELRSTLSNVALCFIKGSNSTDKMSRLKMLCSLNSGAMDCRVLSAPTRSGEIVENGGLDGYIDVVSTSAPSNSTKKVALTEPRVEVNEEAEAETEERREIVYLDAARNLCGEPCTSVLQYCTESKKRNHVSDGPVHIPGVAPRSKKRKKGCAHGNVKMKDFFA